MATKPRSVRQSVTIPTSRVRAEAAEEELKAAYDRFMKGQELQSKNEAGRALIRSIFGKGSIAGDAIR
jgi:hypothetical protein